MEACLQAKNITKVFPGVKALTNISIDFYPGEAHALVGENGAGKSTLIKIMAAVYTATEGSVYLGGKECKFRSPKEALDAGADIIMLDNMSVEDMKEAVKLVSGKAETECSGNVTKENVERLVDIGVDYISSGALTHSSPILDLSLKNLHAI